MPLGVCLGLAVAVCWAISPIAHAAAGRRIGAFPTLLWRSLFASILLVATALVAGAQLPGREGIFMISMSGLAGVGFGDVLVYEALVLLGPRRTVQLLALAPVFAIVLGWMMLGEAVGPKALLGVLLVLGASSAAVWIERRAAPGGVEPGAVTRRGVVCAVGGAALTGLGAVLARWAYLLDPLMDPLAATAVRVGSATALLWIVPLLTGQVPRLAGLLRDRTVVIRITAGTLIGPYLGMLAFVGAFKYLEAGLVMTLVALSPLVILPVIAWRYRTRIGFRVIATAVVAVLGVALISSR